MILKDFKHGMRVRYIPTYANGDNNHKDCENGVVSSVTNCNVFVKYDNLSCKMITGDEPYTAKSTNPKDLILLNEF